MVSVTNALTIVITPLPLRAIVASYIVECMSTDLRLVGRWAWVRLHRAAIVIAVFLSYPLFVPKQAWAAMKADIGAGHPPIFGVLAFAVSVVVSLVMAVLGVALITLPSLMVVAVISSGWMAP